MGRVMKTLKSILAFLGAAALGALVALFTILSKKRTHISSKKVGSIDEIMAQKRPDSARILLDAHDRAERDLHERSKNFDNVADAINDLFQRSKR